MKTFIELIRDGYVRCVIDDHGFATMTLGDNGLKDVHVLVKAINRAVEEGATKGVLFVGEITNPKEARKAELRATRGTLWLGGKVTRLGEGEFGPTFRIDWDELRPITE